MTHLCINAKFSLKDAPPIMHGRSGEYVVVGEHVVFGEQHPAPMSAMLQALTVKVINYHMAYESGDELNAQLDDFVRWLSSIKIPRTEAEQGPQPMLPGLDGTP